MSVLHLDDRPRFERPGDLRWGVGSRDGIVTRTEIEQDGQGEHDPYVYPMFIDADFWRLNGHPAAALRFPLTGSAELETVLLSSRSRAAGWQASRKGNPAAHFPFASLRVDRDLSRSLLIATACRATIV